MIKGLKIIFENENLLVVNKPVPLIVFTEGKSKEKTLSDILFENFLWFKTVGKPPRHGIVHRLDKETSGIILIAKNKKALDFLQEQFKERKAVKKNPNEVITIGECSLRIGLEKIV